MSIWLIILLVWLLPAILIGLMLGWTILKESRQAARHRSASSLQASSADRASSA